MYFNEIREAMKDNKLEKRKVEVEEMHFELKQKFSSFLMQTADAVTLEDIQENFMKIQTTVTEAEEEIRQRKLDMVSKYEADVTRLSKDIK